MSMKKYIRNYGIIAVFALSAALADASALREWLTDKTNQPPVVVIPPTPEPPPVVTPPPAPTEWHKAANVVWLGPRGQDGKKASLIGGTKAYRGKAGVEGIYFEVEGAYKGDWHAGIAIVRDGVIHAGTYDGIGTQPRRQFKGFGNLLGGSKGGPIIGRYGPKKSEAESRAYLRLKPDEATHVFIYETTRPSISALHPVVLP